MFTYSNYSLFAAHRIWESLYFNHNNFIQNEKTAGTRHLRTLLCTLINLHAAFTSKAVNVTSPPKNVYYPNTYHVGKHDSK